MALSCEIERVEKKDDQIVICCVLGHSDAKQARHQIALSYQDSASFEIDLRAQLEKLQSEHDGLAAIRTEAQGIIERLVVDIDKAHGAE
jgi:hypothetical protein